MQPKKTMTAEMRRAAVLEAADAAAAKAKKTKLAAIREGPGSFAVVSVSRKNIMPVVDEKPQTVNLAVNLETTYENKKYPFLFSVAVLLNCETEARKVLYEGLVDKSFSSLYEAQFAAKKAIQPFRKVRSEEALRAQTAAACKRRFHYNGFVNEDMKTKFQREGFVLLDDRLPHKLVKILDDVVKRITDKSKHFIRGAAAIDYAYGFGASGKGPPGYKHHKILAPDEIEAFKAFFELVGEVYISKSPDYVACIGPRGDDPKANGSNSEDWATQRFHLDALDPFVNAILFTTDGEATRFATYYGLDHTVMSATSRVAFRTSAAINALWCEVNGNYNSAGKLQAGSIVLFNSAHFHHAPPPLAQGAKGGVVERRVIFVSYNDPNYETTKLSYFPERFIPSSS